MSRKAPFTLTFGKRKYTDNVLFSPPFPRKDEVLIVVTVVLGFVYRGSLLLLFT